MLGKKNINEEAGEIMKGKTYKNLLGLFQKFTSLNAEKNKL